MTSCLAFEAHLKTVKACCKVGNNKSVEATGLRRIVRMQAILAIAPEQEEVRANTADTELRTRILDILCRECPHLVGAHLRTSLLKNLDLPAGEAHQGDVVWQQGTFAMCKEFYQVSGEDIPADYRFWMKATKMEHIPGFEHASPLLRKRVLELTDEEVVFPVSSVPGLCSSILAVPLDEDGHWLVPYFVNWT